jgi:hypothetical protein
MLSYILFEHRLPWFRNDVVAAMAAEYALGRVKAEAAKIGQMFHLLAASVAGASRFNICICHQTKLAF